MATDLETGAAAGVTHLAAQQRCVLDLRFTRFAGDPPAKRTYPEEI
jgi:hypothetical protein